MNWLKKIATYILGLLLIAIGINISKLAGLGISPVSSIPRALEVVWGFSLGTMVIAVYILLVFLQFVVLGKQFELKNLLGVPVSIAFGWMTDLVGIDPNAFGHLMAWVPAPSGYAMKLVYLAVSIAVIGLGVSIYLKPELLPMPAEGLALAISKKTGKAFGDCKTLVDVGLILVALAIQFVFLGGFDSFSGETIVVREGTIAAAVLVGQVVKLIRKISARTTCRKSQNQ